MNLNKTYRSVEHGSSEGLSRVIKIQNGCHKSKQTAGIEEHGVVAVRRHVPDPVRTRLMREDASWDQDRVPSLPLLLPPEEDADEGEDGGRSRCCRLADGGRARQR